MRVSRRVRNLPLTMKERQVFRTLSLSLAILGLLACAACKDDIPPPPRSAADIDVASPTYNIINLMTASGNKVDVIGGAAHPYFKTRHAAVRVNNGVDLELYEFSSSDDLNEAAASISPDGSKIASDSIAWPAPPHFYKTDKVIILYMGSDRDNMVQLASAFGNQFAGAP